MHAGVDGCELSAAREDGEVIGRIPPELGLLRRGVGIVLSEGEGLCVHFGTSQKIGIDDQAADSWEGKRGRRGRSGGIPLKIGIMSSAQAPSGGVSQYTWGRPYCAQRVLHELPIQEGCSTLNWQFIHEPFSTT
jgi:hypothetical protein